MLKKHNTTVVDVMGACFYQARAEQAFIPHYEEPYTAGDPADIRASSSITSHG